MKSLPVTSQPAGRPEVEARLLSPGGELAVLTDGSVPIRHLNYLELRAGQMRGNHYHKLRHETFYVTGGELELHVQDGASGPREVLLLKAGDMVRIDPGVVHAFLPRMDGQALEYAPEPYDAEDVYREALI